MHHRRRLIVSVGFVIVLTGLGTSLPTAADATASKAKAFVEVAEIAALAPSGQAVTIEVTASCARHWQVLEAFVTVSQPQTFGMAGIPLSCTGREQTFSVTAPSIDQAFLPGSAQASAFVLIERRGTTQQAQDSRVIQLL